MHPHGLHRCQGFLPLLVGAKVLRGRRWFHASDSRGGGGPLPGRGVSSGTAGCAARRTIFVTFVASSHRKKRVWTVVNLWSSDANLAIRSRSQGLYKKPRSSKIRNFTTVRCRDNFSTVSREHLDDAPTKGEAREGFRLSRMLPGRNIGANRNTYPG